MCERNQSSARTTRKDKPRGRNPALTQQKKQEIKEAFELFDTDGSGWNLSCVYFFVYLINLFFCLADSITWFCPGTIDAKELNVAMRYFS